MENLQLVQEILLGFENTPDIDQIRQKVKNDCLMMLEAKYNEMVIYDDQIDLYGLSVVFSRETYLLQFYSFDQNNMDDLKFAISIALIRIQREIEDRFTYFVLYQYPQW